MNFIKIGLTLPDSFPQGIEREASTIIGYLRSGLIDFFHLRKPQWSKQEMENLIRLIPEDLHPHLRLHDHFSLTASYNLGGVHINYRNPVAPSSAVNVSKSCHSVEELLNTCDTCWTYVTLSPIFDSISKPDYLSPFPKDLSVLSPLLKGRNIIAMGGVTFQRIPFLQEVGFHGAALLGDLWKNG